LLLFRWIPVKCLIECEVLRGSDEGSLFLPEKYVPISRNACHMLARAVLIIIGSSFPYRAYVVEKLLYYHLVGDSLLSPKLELAILSNVLARLSVI